MLPLPDQMTSTAAAITVVYSSRTIADWVMLKER
jgi:hypothetical protein